MAGEMDVYQLCPCGSGKKLKFCCHAIVSEMVRISELQQSHQHQAALKLLETAEKKVQPREVWSRAWVKTTKAFLLFAMGTLEEARRLVGEVLDELPEHPLAVAVNGVLAISIDGYPGCTRAVYRAFQIAAEAQPYLVSHLATALAHLMMSKGHVLAAGQYLNLAVRFDTENEEAAEQFMAFFRDARLAYPLRDAYALETVPPESPLKPQFDKAFDLAARGCYSDAAKAFGAIARQNPQQPGLWWNIALCHAWAGEDPLAVEAFKAAAGNESDFESSIDCLVLSRNLRTPAESARISNLSALYNVESVSKLLTILDQKPEFARLEVPEQDAEDDGPRPAAAYRILDRNPTLIASADLNAGNIAHIIGEMAIFDRQSETSPAKAVVTGLGQERLKGLTDALTAAAGELVTADGTPREHGFLRNELVPLIQDWHFPSDLTPVRLAELRLASHHHIIDEVWPKVAQESLGGKTPLEAMGVPELKSALVAAAVDLDVFCEKNGIVFDEAAVRRRLELPLVAESPVPAGTFRRMFSILRLRHVALSQLTDDELALAADHAMRIGHSTLCCRILTAALDRPGLQDKLDTPRLCMYLSRVYARRLDIDAALTWAARGKEACKTRKQPLPDQAIWEIHELMIRANRPDDPQIAQLAATLWNYYVPKIPEIRETVVGVLNELSIPGPWNGSTTPLDTVESLAGAGVGASGLWTPEAETGSQPSKLWLPGQE